jgi:integrase
MATLKPKYTNLRGNYYWLHYKLPTELFRTTNLTSQLIRTSLNTSDPNKAASLAQILVYKVQDYCKTTSMTSITKQSITMLISNILVNLGERQPRLNPIIAPQKISEVFEQYNTEMTKADMWREKSKIDSVAAVMNFIELINDRYITDVGPSVCREYKSKLVRYPLHYKKLSRYNGKSAIDLINSTDIYPTLSTTSVNNQLRKVSSFFNWSLRQGLITSNPISGMKIRTNTNSRAAREPFNCADLKALFSSKVYSEHEFLHDYQFWIPLLALYSGARLEELCQLNMADISIESDIPYLRIDDKFEGQHIKNVNSRRTIPIHPEILNLGFRKFINERRQQESTKLFEYLKPQRQKFGHEPSKWFGRYKIKMGVVSTKKVFHSFRHTMVDKLRKVRAQDYEIKELLGHSSGSVTHDIYGSVDTPIDAILTMLLEVSFKEIIIDVKAW